MSVGSDWVLVVDDDADACDAMRLILDLHGYRSETARDGAEALALLRQGHIPSLILLDLMMPGMDGSQFRKAQLAEPVLADVPVVVLSGGHNTAARAVALGIPGLEKPVNLTELLATVQRYCG